MERKFWKTIDEWNNAKDKMPLLVKGARQVGKTYIIKKYCQEHYKNFCYIDLFDDDNIIGWFRELHTFDEKLEILQIHYGINLKDKDTILFVDEVQESEEFIEALKTFCEKGYTNIICAGSLLGVEINRMNCSFPVGKVYEETMYPLDFEEFLWATGNEKFIPYIKKSFATNTECMFHEDLMNLFYRFLYLGGMPRVIQNYIDCGQKLNLINHRLIKDIITSYIEDMKKYNKDAQENIRINRIYNNIPSQLAKENQKFTYAKIDKKDNRKSNYITALDWLLSSNLVLPCYNITTPEYPLLAYLNDESYKLFLSDTGILCSMTNINSIDIITDGDYKFKGVLTENYVAQELVKLGYDLFYWGRKNDNKGNAEVDFVIQKDSLIIPIEVKAGTDMRSKSLGIYNEQFKPELMIKVSAKNFGIKNNLKTIPLYAIFCLKDKLSK